MCTAATTLTATYNDLEGVRAIFEANKDEIAGVILEPVVGNSGFIPPTQEFLEVRGVPFPRFFELIPALPLTPADQSRLDSEPSAAISLASFVKSSDQAFSASLLVSLHLLTMFHLDRVHERGNSSSVICALGGEAEGARWGVCWQGLRSMCTENGTLLCFDEVMTGFRIAKGCAQAHFNIMPDLTTVCCFACTECEKPGCALQACKHTTLVLLF